MGLLLPSIFHQRLFILRLSPSCTSLENFNDRIGAMRFRLRTLMIVITIICVCLARVAYVQRLAVFHRKQRDTSIEYCAQFLHESPEGVRAWLPQYARYGSDFKVNPWF